MDRDQEQAVTLTPTLCGNEKLNRKVNEIYNQGRFTLCYNKVRATTAGTRQADSQSFTKEAKEFRKVQRKFDRRHKNSMFKAWTADYDGSNEVSSASTYT